jgi:hypothetical protein
MISTSQTCGYMDKRLRPLTTYPQAKIKFFFKFDLKKKNGQLECYQNRTILNATDSDVIYLFEHELRVLD